MDEVADGLFVGTVGDAENVSLLGEHDIAGIVLLIHREPDGGYPPKVSVANVPMRDSPQNDQQIFEQAVTQVLSHLRTGNKLLVHCSVGASRSPAVAATVVALKDEVALDEAFKQVLERREGADPHTALIRQAARVFLELRD